MERAVGTVVRGLRTPIINEGDDIQEIVVDSVMKAAETQGYKIRNRDIVAITESVVARAQGDYASIDDIATDVKAKFGDNTIGLVFPILSRNRFGNVLQGVARGAKDIVIMLSYPSDEVGNQLVDMNKLDVKGINPWTDVLTEEEFRNHFGYDKHPFTGVDYIKYYKEIAESEGATCKVIFSNNPETILDYTKHILACDIHSLSRTKHILSDCGAQTLYGQDDLLSTSINGSSFNAKYGLLGSNRATDETVKLFPNNCQPVVDGIQEKLKERTGKTIEVMVYGDGAYKDPTGKIWELADPVVSPAYTRGLDGQPNEVKLKYLADNNFSHLRGDELKQAIADFIENKEEDLTGATESQGTTPRKLTDLIGSLSDLTSGSGDKGTPVVYIQGYFDNFTK